VGTVYTLVSTTGALTGTFDVPPGGDLTLGASAPACTGRLSNALRIDYHESGSPQTVTGTVVPAPPPGVRPGVAGAAPVSGVVLVRLAGRRGFTALKPGSLIPVGAELDTLRGRVRLFVSSNRRGGITTAELYGGRFILRQSKGARPTTGFDLSQALTGCGRSAGRSAAAARGRPRRTRSRYIWVTEPRGSFNTHGLYVSTSVQGTTWLTEDTCTTSRVKVRQGIVLVHDLLHHRTVKLHAGQTYVVRKRR
jgi:hypothetical protein